MVRVEKAKARAKAKAVQVEEAKGAGHPLRPPMSEEAIVRPVGAWRGKLKSPTDLCSSRTLGGLPPRSVSPCTEWSSR